MSRRALIWATLGLLAIVAGVWLAKRRREPEVASAPAPAETEARGARRRVHDDLDEDDESPTKDQHEPSEPVARAAPDLTQAAPSPSDAAVQPGKPLAVPVREHAKAIILPTIARALDRGDVDNLNQVLQLARDHPSDHLLSDADMGALEAASACLERAPDAREEAADLLRFGGSTALADGVRKACTLR